MSGSIGVVERAIKRCGCKYDTTLRQGYELTMEDCGRYVTSVIKHELTGKQTHPAARVGLLRVQEPRK